MSEKKRPARKSSSPPRIDQQEQLHLNMLRSVVTEPLRSRVLEEPSATYDVIIALNENFEQGLARAHELMEARVAQWDVMTNRAAGYCFAALTGQQILALADETRSLADERGRGAAVVHRIWEDSSVQLLLHRSLVTVKADAAQRAFEALGDGITWAVMDSGIAQSHPHFRRDASPVGPIDTLAVSSPLTHEDFTPDGRARASDTAHPSALEDRLGHGTHVAGIIAGYWESSHPDGEPVLGTETQNERTGTPDTRRESLRRISGVAPRCRVVSLKVIADRDRTDAVKQTRGEGKVSWMLMAIDRIQEWNQHGRRLQVHGVNMSVGYDFDPRWFACGQSPLCVEVNRLVKSGVHVVVAAGNSGYPMFISSAGRPDARYMDMSITDPGNADLAITVGSTHRESPHLYGVSYFSSRGPTGDGRMKPDLVAPGERIRSCAAGAEADKYTGGVDNTSPAGSASPALYCELSGTSMAAPHVSGAIAAFLSVRTEFIGQPERVKALLMASAIDLGRERHFQGAGLLDLMRTLQSV
ncbi:S8 family peptidase [Gemmatimonas phototrophica]|uniref:S8 family peptidase n=1 Tax=Gemmatimonas phototrophica TaxID=1379270 RepID=UPI0006A71751|nr:S8 family peptidase [Gemmatimonas phototrophica]